MGEAWPRGERGGRASIKSASERRRGQPQRLDGLLHGSSVQNVAWTVLYVPYSLGSARRVEGGYRGGNTVALNNIATGGGGGGSLATHTGDEINGGSGGGEGTEDFKPGTGVVPGHVLGSGRRGGGGGECVSVCVCVCV